MIVQTSGRPMGSIGAACNLPNTGTCYADYNPNVSGPVRINGDYGDGDVLSRTHAAQTLQARSFLRRNASGGFDRDGDEDG